MRFWWQSLWKRVRPSCCLFPAKVKLTQFHHVIIPQLPYNGEPRRHSYKPITGRNDISECHLWLCYLLHSEGGEHFRVLFPGGAIWLNEFQRFWSLPMCLTFIIVVKKKKRKRRSGTLIRRPGLQHRKIRCKLLGSGTVELSICCQLHHLQP